MARDGAGTWMLQMFNHNGMYSVLISYDNFESWTETNLGAIVILDNGLATTGDGVWVISGIPSIVSIDNGVSWNATIKGLGTKNIVTL